MGEQDQGPLPRLAHVPRFHGAWRGQKVAWGAAPSFHPQRAPTGPGPAPQIQSPGAPDARAGWSARAHPHPRPAGFRPARRRVRTLRGETEAWAGGGAGPPPLQAPAPTGPAPARKRPPPGAVGSAERGAGRAGAMAAQRLGKRVLSKLQAPSRARGPGGSPGALQKRHARVTVKYDRRELQRRLDVEKWIDARLEELYRGRVSGCPWARGPRTPGRGVPGTHWPAIRPCMQAGTHTWVSGDAPQHLGRARGSPSGRWGGKVVESTLPCVETGEGGCLEAKHSHGDRGGGTTQRRTAKGTAVPTDVHSDKM